DFNDVTPKAAISPPGIYICWGDNAVILDKAHRNDDECYTRYAAVEAKLKKRRAELMANPSDSGCIDKDWVTCIATISLTNQVTTGILNTELIEPTFQRDLDGKILPENVWADVFPTHNPALPQATQEADHFELRLDDQGRVSSIS